MEDLENIHIFKEVTDICGEEYVFYRLIGANLTFIHDKEEESIQVLDGELGVIENALVYEESRFFEEYSGYEMGTDDVSIEDLIRFEYKTIIDNERSDTSPSKLDLAQYKKTVSFSGLAHIVNSN